MWLLLASALAPAHAQIWVAPRRAGQSVFRDGDLEWQTIELLHDEPIRDQEAGGVRLFFYESERETAERAAALLEQNYRRLAEVFDFTPRKRFDYVVGVPLAFDGSPGAELLAHRSIAPDTGRSTLVVVDPRAGNRRRRVVSGGRPGVEEGESHADRDAQFLLINAEAKRFMQKGQPVISVDAS